MRGECLEQLLGHLLEESRRWDVWRFRLFDSGDATHKVHLIRLPDLGALPDLVPEVETGEDRDVDVRSEESGGVEVPEDVEAVDEDTEGRPEDTPDGQVGLEGGVVNELGAVDALALQAGVEAEVGQV